MEGGERGREGKVKESEGETRSREGFGPPKNFGVAPPWCDATRFGSIGDFVLVYV